jgi:hypothetical protein
VGTQDERIDIRQRQVEEDQDRSGLRELCFRFATASGTRDMVAPKFKEVP